MSELPNVGVKYSDGFHRTKVTFANGDSEELFLSPVRENVYLLEESFVFGEAYYHDLIEGTLLEDGSVRFLRVAKPSGLATRTWMLSKDIIESERMKTILSEVMTCGGMWEQVFGGMLLVHLPAVEIDQIVERINGIINPNVR